MIKRDKSGRFIKGNHSGTEMKKGCKSPMEGKKHTEKTRKRLSEILTGKPGRRRGCKVSEETKKKISESSSTPERIKISIANLPKNNKGEKSPSWKGGITPENERIRHSSEYYLWRELCFKRDNYTCQVSGEKGGKLVIHHINNFSDFPELRLVVDNGFTMTKDLHKKFHSIYGIKNNTKEQLEEFINNTHIDGKKDKHDVHISI